MAKKDNLGLLQEIVSQLRTLNRSSVRDQLREAEAAKRAEKLATVTEEGTETNVGLIDAATDFQRRFIAGQARTEFNSRIKDKPASRDDQEALYKLLDSRLAPAALADNNQIPAGAGEPSGEGSPAAEARAEREEMMRKQWLNQRIFAILAEQRAREQDQTNARFDLDPMNQTAEDARASAEALEELAHHATQSGSIFTNDIHATQRLDTLIAFAKATEERRLKERNNDMRTARENRLEGIGGPGSTGATGAQAFGASADEDGEGGLFGIPGLSGLRAALGVGAGGALFGAVKFRTQLVGMMKKLIPNWKSVKGFPKLAMNPRNWSGILRKSMIARFALLVGTVFGIGAIEDAEDAASDDGEGFGISDGLWTALGAYQIWGAAKWIGVKTGIKLGIVAAAKKAFSGAAAGTLRFFLMRALTAAGVFAAGAVGIAGAPLWIGIAVAGIVAWKWDAITNAIFGAADIDGDASTAAGIDALAADSPQLFDIGTNLSGKVDLALDNAKRVNERRIQEMFSHLDKDQDDYAERIKQITDLAITGGYSQETIDRLIAQSQGIYEGIYSGPNRFPLPGADDLMAGGSPNGRGRGTMSAEKRKRLRNLANVYQIGDEFSDTGDASRQDFIQNYQNKIAQVGDVVTNTVTNHYYQNETHALGTR